ncbi:MAG: peptidase C25, partial [Thermoplasmata archaeon]
SDLYFADIYKYEGNNITFDDWDSNGNGIYAEWWMYGKDILDMYPDVYVGRLPCRNKFEVDIMVKKIITYETTTYGQQWFKKFVGIGGDTFAMESDPYYEGELGVSVAAGYLEDIGFETTKLFTSTNSLGGANDIISGVSQGCGFLDFEGHGNPMSWATHPPYDDETWIGIDESQFIQFSNKGMYPICMIGGCHNSQFDISLLNLLDVKNLKDTVWHSTWGPECFSWWMARKIDGGAIATIGSTGYGYGTIGDSDDDGVPDCIQYVGGFIDSEFFRVYAQEGKDILGEVHGTAITNYITKFPPMQDKIDAKTVQEWILMGDPSLKIGGYPS